MTTPPDPVLDVLIHAAVDATAANDGWLLHLEPNELRVVAAAGSRPGGLLGRRFPLGVGSAGYVASSGQPVAVAPAANYSRFSDGVAAALGRSPASVLCVPCAAEDDVVGVLEVIDKRGGKPFTIDDVELTTLLGGIAAVAMRRTAARPAVPSADQLAGELRRLGDADPARYAEVATLLATLLAHG